MSAGKLLALARDDFVKLLGDLKQLRHTWRFEALRRVPLLQQLSHAARSQLCDIFQQARTPALCLFWRNLCPLCGDALVKRRFNKCQHPIAYQECCQTTPLGNIAIGAHLAADTNTSGRPCVRR